MSWLSTLPVATVLLANVSNGAVPEPTIQPPASESANRPVAVPPQETESRWYGWPALAVDGATVIGALAVADKSPSNSSRAFYGALAVYLLGAPIAHFVHGNRERSADSFVLRVGGLAAGVVGVLLVADASSGCGAEASAHHYCPLIYGSVVPPMVTMLLDDLLLARESVAQPSWATVSPRVLVQPGLALFGVGGSF